MKPLTQSNDRLFVILLVFLVFIMTIGAFFLIPWDAAHPIVKEGINQPLAENQDETPLDSSIEGVENGFVASPAGIDSIEAKKQAWAALLSNHPYYTRPAKTPEEWKTVPKQDRPDLAMEQDYLMTMDPALGGVPFERLRQANEEMGLRLLEKSAISGIDWQERGPDNVGGRTRALVFDPNDPTDKKVWAGGVSGGLWYTNDITASSVEWTHVDGFWDNIAISCIAFNPGNTQEIYVGTGEGWFNSDAQLGGGIWKSSDGGTTWALLGSTEPGGYASSSDFHHVNKIVIKSNGTIFAATRAYYINRGGILRSTNGGTTWTRVVAPYSSDNTVYDRGADVEIAANGDVYASIGVGSKGKVYKSTNANDGASGTWTDLSSNIGMGNAKRVELACAPSDANTVYAVAQGGSGDNDVEWFKKSTDGGATWSSITIPKLVDDGTTHFTRSQAFYNLILAVHPSNSSYVLAGGIDLHRTQDGGTTWTGISHWYGGFSKPEVHADQHAIQFRPDASNEAIFGNDGGVFYSANAGNSVATPSFASKNSGYNVTQFYACASENEKNSHYFLAGAQDNGSNQFTQPQVGPATEVTGGDGAYCHIDQLNSLIQTTQYTYNRIYRSLNGGLTFPQIVSQTTGLFINPSEYDSDRKILYASASSDTIKRVSGMDGTITNTDLSIAGTGGKISALKMSPYNNVLFLGIANGKVYKLVNPSTGSPTLTRLDNGSTPITTAGWVSSVEVGANDNHLLVTYSNYGVTSVWETTDGGTTWYSKEGNLPDIPIRWAIYNPDNRNQVLLATELGVWTTDNFGPGTNSAPMWGASNMNLAHTRCTMLKYRPADKMVVVSTHGRGLFTSDVFVTQTIADMDFDFTYSCSSSKTVQFTDASLKPNNSWAWDVNNDGVTDYTTRNPMHTYSSPGVYTVKLTVNSGSSTAVKDKKIVVAASAPTANTGCALSSNSNNGNPYGIGIFRFALGDIDYSTSHNDDHYQDYTCSQWTTLELNASYYVTIRTGTANSEGAIVYIDYDDDGSFEPGEVATSFPSNTAGTRTVLFTTPSSGVTLNKGLRMRVLSKFGGIPTTGCDISTYGQAEDYTVYFVSPTSYADYGDLDPLTWTQAKAVTVFEDSDYDGEPDGTGSVVWAGDLVDAETVQAGSDSGSGFADEDGLVHPSGSLSPGQSYNFTVHTNSNSSSNFTRYYRLWFDWNSDGTFDESISGNVTGTGVLDAVHNVQVSLSAGSTFKIRLVVDDTSIPASPASGIFTNAEVEDYSLPVQAPLPVELTAFEVSVKGCNTELFWQTASEWDVSGFQLESSLDGIFFQSFAEQKPQSARSVEWRSYSYPIPTRLQGQYYRLKTIDLDGSFTYSPVVFGKIPCEQALGALVFPNPATSEATLQWTSRELYPYLTLELTDELGRVVRLERIQSSIGTNTVQFSLDNLPAGIYFVLVRGMREPFTPLRLVKK